MKKSYPELATDFGRISRSRTPRRRRSAALSRRARRSSTPRCATPRPAARTTLRRRPGVPAARHVRLPDRPHARDGRRAGRWPSTRRASAADGGAARAGQGRRAGEEDRARGPSAYRELLDGRRAPSSSPATTRSTSEARSRGLLRRRRGRGRGERGRRRRGRARPHPVLRRGRRPARRRGPDRLGDGAMLEVLDVQPPLPGLIVHRARSSAARSSSARPCTPRSTSSAAGRSAARTPATHMVHAAFREALGETATQAGSENAPGRFRFDFALSRAPCRRRCCATSRTRCNALLVRRTSRCTPQS